MDSKPWKDVLVDSKEFTVYKDGYPVTEGHILFVPKEEKLAKLTKCLKPHTNGAMTGLNADTVMRLILDRTLEKRQDRLLCFHVLNQTQWRHG